MALLLAEGSGMGMECWHSDSDGAEVIGNDGRDRNDGIVMVLQYGANKYCTMVTNHYHHYTSPHRIIPAPPHLTLPSPPPTLRTERGGMQTHT